MNKLPIRSVIIIGAGGHAKVLAEMLQKSKRHIIGVTDPNKKEGETSFGLNVIGDDEVIKEHDKSKVELVNGIGALPGNNIRWNIAKRFRDLDYTFATVIHPSAIISNDIILKDGVQIMAGCIIQPGVEVGQDSIINTGVILDHDCKIGKSCHIAPGVTLCGGVDVGNGAHVGAGTISLQYKRIGANTIVAAGSIVHRDINENTVFIQPRKETDKKQIC